MDLLSRARRNLRGIQAHSAEWGSSAIPPNSATPFAGSVGGVGGALGISTVMSCIRVLHDDVGILPFVAHTGDRNAARTPLPDQPPIVAAPFGPDVTVAAGMGQIVVSLRLRGNAYLHVDAADSHGWPSQVSVIDPDHVRVERTSDGRKRFVIAGANFGPERIRHITGLMLPGAISGLDPISYQRLTLQSAADVAAYGSRFFSAGGTPAGVISVPGPGDRKKAREVKEAWEAGHSGVANAHRPAVVFGGAKWEPMTVAPENAQFLQTRGFLREEICGWFGVPLQRIMAITDNASQGGGKGLESIDAGYATHTLLPITTAIERVWDGMIPGDQRTWTRFDFGALLRASALERAQIAQLHRLIGVRNRDEIRADEGWAPIGGAEGTDYSAPFATNTAPPKDGADK